MEVPSRAEHEAIYAAYVQELKRTWPKLRFVKKGEDRFSRLIDRTLRILTFGGQGRYLTDFVTTIGRTIYLPDDWDMLPAGQRYTVLRHEAIHLAQFRRFTLPGMTLLYVLLPVPVGLAAGRAALEWEAYRETIRAHWQLYGRDAARAPELSRHIVARFTGPEYAWMWVFGGRVRRWVARELARLEAAPPPPLARPGAAGPTP